MTQLTRPSGTPSLPFFSPVPFPRTPPSHSGWVGGGAAGGSSPWRPRRRCAVAAAAPQAGARTQLSKGRSVSSRRFCCYGNNEELAKFDRLVLGSRLRPRGSRRRHLQTLARALVHLSICAVALSCAPGLLPPVSRRRHSLYLQDLCRSCVCVSIGDAVNGALRNPPPYLARAYPRRDRGRG